MWFTSCKVERLELLCHKESTQLCLNVWRWLSLRHVNIEFYEETQYLIELDVHKSPHHSTCSFCAVSQQYLSSYLLHLHSYNLLFIPASATTSQDDEVLYGLVLRPSPMTNSLGRVVCNAIIAKRPFRYLQRTCARTSATAGMFPELCVSFYQVVNGVEPIIFCLRSVRRNKQTVGDSDASFKRYANNRRKSIHLKAVCLRNACAATPFYFFEDEKW